MKNKFKVGDRVTFHEYSDDPNSKIHIGTIKALDGQLGNNSIKILVESVYGDIGPYWFRDEKDLTLDNSDQIKELLGLKD